MLRGTQPLSQQPHQRQCRTIYWVFESPHPKLKMHFPTRNPRLSTQSWGFRAIISIMIPMDTVKTRLVTQTVEAGVVPYKGVLRTLSRIVSEEGIGSVYRSLTPRLVSVVPMIGIQVRCVVAAGLLSVRVRIHAFSIFEVMYLLHIYDVSYISYP